MKTFLWLMFIINFSFAAKLDTALFEGKDILPHLAQIEKTLNNPMQQKLKSQETIALEKSTLKKLKQLYTVKNDIKPFTLISLTEGVVSQEKYLEAFLRITALKLEIERLEEKEKSIQEKLFSLKNSIENALADEQNQSILNTQLLYAFYKISQEKIHHSLSLYQTLFKQEFPKLKTALNSVSCKAQSTEHIIQKTDKKIDAIKNQNLLLDIDKDSEAKRGKQAQKAIKVQEKHIQNASDDARIKKIKAQTLLAFQALQEKKQEQFLTLIQEIQNDTSTLSEDEKPTYKTMLHLLESYSSTYLNSTSISLASTEFGLSNLQKQLKDFVNQTLFVYEEKAFSLKTIIIFISIIMIGAIIARVYKKIVSRHHKKNRIKSLSSARLMANSGYYLIILSTFFIALKAIGLDMHTIALLFGAVLLWLAFGMQGFIANYAVGILIKIDRSIRIGDNIELDAHTAGTVDDMDFRSVTIETSDHVRITIPNSRFIAGSFVNHSLEDNVRRIHIPFSVDKETSLLELESRILANLQESSIQHVKSSTHQARVILTDINRKISRYALLVWIKQENSHDIAVLHSAFLALIQRTLQERQVFK